MLSVLILPILSVWFNYPIAIPQVDVLVVEKALISLAWILVIGFLYYRRKINRIYKKMFD